MKKTSWVERRVEVVDDVFCNRCERSMKDSMGNVEGLQYYICGGYESLIGDQVELLFDVCETCLLEWFKDFKISPYLTANES